MKRLKTTTIPARRSQPAQTNLTNKIIFDVRERKSQLVVDGRLRLSSERVLLRLGKFFLYLHKLFMCLRNILFGRLMRCNRPVLSGECPDR